jgi:hypothetical protein
MADNANDSSNAGNNTAAAGGGAAQPEYIKLKVVGQV